jgi:hypothetical protein
MKRRALGLIAIVVAMLLSVLASVSPAQADDSSCQSAANGYVCTYVAGQGTWVSHVYAIRGKAVPVFDICRSSAWAYYIPPWGGAYGIGYTERNDCVYGRAAALMYVNRWLPSGSRVCTKFMEYGVPVGGEPCVTVR